MMEPVMATVETSPVEPLTVDRGEPLANESNIARVCPTSFSQRALWVLEQILPDHSVYNEFDIYKLAGVLDIEALSWALNEIVRRHEVLRTSFRVDNGEPIQVVAATVRLPLELTDLSALPEKARGAEAKRHAREEARKPFDVEHAPLFRVRLLRLEPTEHWLLLTGHHLIRDGSSMVMFAEELSQLYGAHRSGSVLPAVEPPLQFGDYAAWQRDRLRGSFLAEQLAYWGQTLVDLPALDLPTDRPRPPVPSYRGARLAFRLPEELTRKLKELRRREQTTLFTILLASLQVLLYRYTGQEDIAVGVPVAGRVRPEFARSIGYFTNVLVVRGDLAGDPSFREYLARVHSCTRAAYAHQEVPFAKLVEELAPKRDRSRNPLVQVSIVKGTEPGETPQLPGLEVTRIETSGTETVKFDLDFSVAEDDGRIDVVIGYATDLFDAASIERMAGHWRVLLEAIVADPQQRISGLGLLTGEELRQLEQWNAAAVVDYPRMQCLHALFEAQVQRTGQASALVFENEQLSYAELNARANRLAHYLRRLGVGAEVPVALAMERSVELVVGMLAILKAGGAYVPLDPSYPAERLGFMLADTQAPVLLTQERLRGRLPAYAGRTVAVDGEQPSIAREPEHSPEARTTAENLAYIIYTSGSTGQPKGVMIEHRALVNHMLWMQRRFPLEASDRVLQKTPASFDAAVWEFYAPLLAGACLVVADPEAHRSAQAIVDAVMRERITVLQLVPSMLAVILDDPGIRNCPSLRRVYCGGEVLATELIRRFRAQSRAELVNLYGPTEATIDATYCVCTGDDEGQASRIGRPIDNVSAYVLSSARESVPIGVVGELYLGGDGLSRGYWRRPDLTSEAFITYPVGPNQSMRLYRTGDLARFLADGTLAFAGRRDQQVKLRGQRVELGEIEACLMQHPRVAEAVVALAGRDGGDPCLVAYLSFASDGFATPAELREFLGLRLPPFMVPAIFIRLESFPRLPSGKIDRKRLPEPTLGGIAAVGSEQIAPRDGTEEVLRAIFADVLGLERVGVHDDFFDLGGDSLLVVQLLARVKAVFDAPVSVQGFFSGPTIAQLAQEIVQALASHGAPGAAARLGVPAIRRHPRASIAVSFAGAASLPLSPAQQQLWLLDRLLGGRPVYNVWAVLRLVGPLEVGALREALRELVQRHEILRTRFGTAEAGPVQLIAPQLDCPLEVEAVGALPEGQREMQARRRAQELVGQPFDLESGPLLRARLLDLGGAEHWLVLALHHIVIDGWSFGVLWRELSELYAACVQGRPAALAELPVQYADYAVWQRERLHEEAAAQPLAYWKEALAELPVLELSTDRPRPSVPSYRGGRIVFELGEELTRGLKEIGRRERATLFMTLLASVQVLLYRYSGQEDFAVGVPVAGRTRPELEGLIGYFVNMLVLRAELSGEPTFREYLGRVRERALAAYAHQEVPFLKVVEALARKRDPSRNPLFDVSFALENTPLGALRLAGVEVSEVSGIYGETAKFDLSISATEHGGGIGVTIEYATDLFDAATIERMAGHWRVLLEGIVADPERRVSHLPLLTAGERERLLVQWNATAVDYPHAQCLQELFEAQVQRTPQASALIFENERLSYAELNARANRLAHYLRGLGVGAEVPVALALERSVELVVGMLAILKAGGAYVPLDPSYPSERLGFMLEDTQAPVLLTQERLRGRLPAYAGRTVYVDAERAHFAGEPEHNPGVCTTAENLAYIIYTSGSTGTPKGVLIPQRAVARLVCNTDYVQLGAGDVVAHLSNPAFDAATFEIWGALLNGASLVALPRETVLSLPELAAALNRHGVTTLFLTTALFNLMARDAPQAFTGRVVLFGGEAADPRSVAAGLVDGKPRRLLHVYGPTETTTFATWHEVGSVAANARTVPIGRPIANTEIYLLDRNGEPVPQGTRGEIYIGGPGLARGYLRRPELTAERFVAHAFSGEPEARLYRTGDHARLTSEGLIEHLGRGDHQVKIRGFRVELGEIEAVLKQQKGIRDAAVLLRDKQAGEKRLVAFVVPTGGQTMRPVELRASIARMLPDYMVPAAFVALDALPLTPNGKVDRESLAKSKSKVVLAVQTHVSPRNAVEVQLMRIWEQVLRVSPIGMHDNFFALGGDSLAAVRVIDRIEQLFSRRLPPDLLWYQEGTIESLARSLVDDGDVPLWTGPVPIKASGRRRPLFCPHIVGGHLFFYDNLARHLHDDQPLYGLPARGLDGKSAPDSSIKAMAAHCIDSMRQVQATGPYLLAGYCSGALIAFEMACQLRAQGEQVGLLAILDSLPPAFRLLELVQTTWAFLRLKNVRLVQQRFYRFVLQNLGLSNLRKFRTVSEAHYWALFGYRPPPYHGSAVLFRGVDAGYSRDGSQGWSRFVTGDLDICTLPTEHGGMVKEPMVRVLAQKLEVYLQRAAQVPRAHEARPVMLEPKPALGL
jgi:amino acid adenylation domain-containing protein